MFPLVTGLALWGGLIIGAVYMTRAVRNVLHGPLPDKWAGLADATSLWRKLPYALLLASLFVFGCFPAAADGENHARCGKNCSDGDNRNGRDCSCYAA